MKPLTTTCFYYKVETKEGKFVFYEYYITYNDEISSYTKTHEEIGPILLRRALKDIAIENVIPITKEEYFELF